ncbi:DUF234 domain-containing protein [Campylobacter sp. MG1]|uniref:DUF234 domain-containing protein n=1 Tax=Campylobacter sp. MG1 TaxID=2976332 RepID=UPI00226D18DC|nr:DUF234 domain-containing protein [Campylobacter sp. MG1]
MILNYNPYKFHLNDNECKILTHFARKSRLEFSINKKVSRFKARKIFYDLINKNIIKIEKNCDLFTKNKNFAFQDKVIFKSNFMRFYFYFLKPYEKLIFSNKDEAYQKILSEFNNYLSYIFEMVACEFCERYFNIYGVQSIWGKDYECDIYYNDFDFTLLGEVKFNGKKMCLNSYSKLQNKAKLLGLEPNKFIFFSKNLYSKKLQNLNDNRLILASLKDFEKFK